MMAGNNDECQTGPHPIARTTFPNLLSGSDWKPSALGMEMGPAVRWRKQTHPLEQNFPISYCWNYCRNKGISCSERMSTCKN